MASLTAAPNYRRSNFSEMLITRKEVSHLAYEFRRERHYIVFLLHHAGVWAYHADSHPRYYECHSPKECLRSFRSIDRRLKSGQSLLLKLQGSNILMIQGL